MSHRSLVCVVSVLATGLLVAANASAQISSGYTPPRSKTGLHTFYEVDATRSATHDAVQLGLKTYNIFWHDFEAPNLPSSSLPNLSCPTDYAMVPANAGEKAARGYHRYRCLSTSRTELFRQGFVEDQAHNIQTLAVLYGSPEQYRNAGCEGFIWNNTLFKLGCVPRDNAMNDFEDFINYVAYTFSGQNGSPKLSHYIIWSETASGAWFDNTPIVPTHRDLTAPELSIWIDKYASMLTRAHAAIQRHTSGVLMHVGTDPLWYHTTPSGQWLQPFSGVVNGTPQGWNKLHIGSRTMLEGLWARIGLSIDWSLTIHPFGEPSTVTPTWMNFANVPALVAFQNQKLLDRGITPALNRPQELIFATQFDWPEDPPAVCRAHSLAVALPNLVGYTQVTHISNVDGTPNAYFPFYASSNPAVWALRNDHRCCETQGLGCLPWQNIAGSGTDIGIGADGSVWVIGLGGAIYRRVGTTWQTMPGAAARIDVGPDGAAWIVNSLGQIFRWNGSTWIGLPGGARDIGVGANGAAWIIGLDNFVYRWTGSTWQAVTGAAARIDVGPDGNPWVVAANGSIYRWNGTAFDSVGGLAQDVSVGSDGSVFVTSGAPGSGDGAVYRYSTPGGFVPVNGTGTQISAGPAGTLWVVRASGAIYTR